jgi:hypothetical protein
MRERVVPFDYPDLATSLSSAGWLVNGDFEKKRRGEDFLIFFQRTSVKKRGEKEDFFLIEKCIVGLCELAGERQVSKKRGEESFQQNISEDERLKRRNKRALVLSPYNLHCSLSDVSVFF